MRFHTQTAGVSLTAQQPLVNIVRTAIEALAGVLGGTQSLHTNSFDEALALPTEEAVRVALRTQQVIAHETGVTNTIDPLGGSYFVEALTDEMERRGLRVLRPHRRARRHGRGDQARLPAARDRRRLVPLPAGGRLRASGSWSASTSTASPTRRSSRSTGPIPRSSESRRAGCPRPARRRDSGAVERALAALKRAASAEGENLMPYFLDAARARASEGEMVAALQEVFGSYTEQPVF